MAERELVRNFFEAMQARDWDAARACLAENLEVVWPATGERFCDDAFLHMQRAYPEGWSAAPDERWVTFERTCARK